MSSDDDTNRPPTTEPDQGRAPYCRPQIIWREPYEPMSFGVSCAKQPGACQPFPINA